MKNIKFKILTFENLELQEHKTVNIKWTNYSLTAGKFGSEDFDIFGPKMEKKETHHDISDLELEIFPEDSILDFKNKIFAYLGYFPAEQYYEGNPDYEIELNGKLYVPEMKKTEEDINGIPVDRYFYNLHETAHITNLEHNSIVDYIIKNNFTISMIPASLLLAKNKDLSGHDLELIYWSIVQFYPYFSPHSIQDFLGERNSFPLIFPSQKSVLATVTEQDQCYREIYKEVKTNKFYNKLSSLFQGKNNKSSNTFISIILLSADIQNRGRVNLESLFKMVHTSEDLLIIVYSTRTRVITKIFNGMENEYRKHQFSFRNKPDTIDFLYGDLLFEIRNDGKIAVLAKFSENQRKDFVDVKKSIEESSRKFLKYVDNLDFNLFAGKNHIVEKSKSQHASEYKVREISANFIISKQMKDDISTFAKTLNVKGVVKNITENSFYWLKAAKRASVDNWNEFDGEIVTTSKFTIISRLVDIKIEMRGMTDRDFINFFIFITAKLLMYSDTNEVKNKTPNNLKLLQMEDPKLYIMNTLGSKTVYARLCQSQEKQPIILPEGEIRGKSARSILKFWNYTKEEPAYYYCAHENFPIPYFITDYHPLGYCMVCCKKTESASELKQIAHNECLEKHVSVSENVSEPTRYINVYGKELEVGRLGHVPDLIARFVLYNIENINIIPESITLQLFRYNGNLYSLEKIFKVTENSKIYDIELKQLHRALHAPTFKRKRKERGLIRPIEIIENPQKNKKYANIYKKIMAANVTDTVYIYTPTPFSNQKTGKPEGEFIVISGIYQIAKAYIEKIKSLRVKIVTSKQLKRSAIGAYGAESVSFIDESVPVKFGGDDNKEPFYYLFAVKKYYNNLNCSLGYSLAAALGMDFTELVKLGIPKIPRLKDLLSTREFYGINESENWNAVFYDLCNFLDIIPLIFYDENFTRISTNIQHCEPKFTLMLPENVSTFDQYHNKQFLLLLRRRSHDINLIGSKYTFYPIFIVIPYAFFRSEKFEKTLFEYDDPIIKIIEKFLLPELSHVYDLELIKKFLQLRKMKITGYFAVNGTAFAIQIDDEICFSIRDMQIFDGVILDKKMCKTKNPKKVLDLVKDYLEYRNIPLDISEIYKYKSNYTGIKINGKTFFIESATLKMDSEVKVTELNHDIIDIIYSNGPSENKLLNKWLDLTQKRNDYSKFKEDFFKKIKRSDLEKLLNSDKSSLAGKINKIMKSPFAEDLAIEFGDPVKKALFLNGTYIFEQLQFKESNDESIYVKKQDYY